MSDEDGAVRVFRPDRRVAGLTTLLFAGTGLLLIGLGFVLEPADREAMDGFQRLLFTVVPIKPFAWAMGAVFIALGARVASRGFRGPASLEMSDAGLVLPGEGVVPWSAVSASLPNPESLMLEIDRATGPEQIVLSQFDLGRSPEAVLGEIRGFVSRLAPGGSDEGGA